MSLFSCLSGISKKRYKGGYGPIGGLSIEEAGSKLLRTKITHAQCYTINIRYFS